MPACMCAKRADLTVYVRDVCDDAPLAHNVMHTHAAVAIELFPGRVLVVQWGAIATEQRSYKRNKITSALGAR